jgi:hypothetical protein
MDWLLRTKLKYLSIENAGGQEARNVVKQAECSPEATAINIWMRDQAVIKPDQQ